MLKTSVFIQIVMAQNIEVSLGPHCATVDTFATCDFNFRIRKYAQCGPRL